MVFLNSMRCLRELLYALPCKMRHLHLLDLIVLFVLKQMKSIDIFFFLVTKEQSTAFVVH